MFNNIAQEVPLQRIDFYGRELWIKRLDLVHPYISGNKFYKLKYNFLAAQAQGYQHVLTFGGAYSNHIAATAFAAQLFGWKSTAIIRGEELAERPYNSTLALAHKMGMQFRFVSREMYRQKNHPEFLQFLQHEYPDAYILPEGGTNAFAIQGCQEILNADDLHQFNLICCAVGTGGTITGLIEASHPNQQILGFSALKGDFLTQEVQQLTSKKNWQITEEFCCGGYAKTTPELLKFIQNFEQKYQIPLEHIYTGKMMMGLLDLIQHNHFPAHTRILAIHTGGLQGKLKVY
ncbi:1-aminocyclopropane-1-carboxylate deaminase/D-cysteine desulfhydrase [Acinetobacter sp. YH12021]|uniref:1-aminocyclopropane-1-carboxylate deaminase/D-cysteine desulfhydrase n=1 Tax=Acinetobacter sp. YH12021 TaxID=2601040 RepID=UPI0015D34258|nr:pyridoxal-phosphate dependent enzyme [Acinetobacter sp. YH12021]